MVNDINKKIDNKSTKVEHYYFSLLYSYLYNCIMMVNNYNDEIIPQYYTINTLKAMTTDINR